MASSGLSMIIERNNFNDFVMVMLPNSLAHKNPVALSGKMMNFFAPSSHPSVPNEAIGKGFLTVIDFIFTHSSGVNPTWL